LGKKDYFGSSSEAVKINENTMEAGKAQGSKF
jgi:hypothetical protein